VDEDGARTTSDIADASEAGETSDQSARPTSVGGRRMVRFLEVSPVRVATVVGVAFALVLGALCVWLGFGANAARTDEKLRGELIQAARQGAVNLTTIDYEHAESDMQRILDSATGEFYDEFNTRSGPFIDVLKKAKSKTAGTVTEAGLEALDGKSAEVLVAVSVGTVNGGVPEGKPRFWRRRIIVVKQGDEAKVSKVDFIP